MITNGFFTGTNNTITIDVGVSLASATDVILKIKTPSETKQVDSSELTIAGQTVSHVLKRSTTQSSGAYQFQVWYKIGGRQYKSGIVKQTIINSL